MEYLRLLLLIFILSLNYSSRAQSPVIDSIKSILFGKERDTTKVDPVPLFMPVPDHSARIDSLKSILGGLAEDTVKVNTLNMLASLSFPGDDDAKIYSTEAKLLAEKLNYRKGLASAYRNIGSGYLVQGDHLETLRNWEISLYFAETIGDKKMLGTLNTNLGLVYNRFGVYEKAIEYHLRALKIEEERTDSFRISGLLTDIGWIYSEQPEYRDSALKYYRKAIKMNEALDRWNGVGSSTRSMGEIYAEKEEYDSALYYFNKSLILLTDKFVFALVLHDIGKVYSDMEDYQKARTYYQYSLEVARKEPDAQGFRGWLVVSNLLGIASIYENLDKPATAIMLFKEAEQPTIELGKPSYQSELYEGLTSSYEKLSDYTNAFRYQALLINTLDSLDKIEKANLDEEREFKLELLKNEKEDIIESLEQQAAIEKLTNKRQKFINFGVISAGIVLLIFTSLLIQRFRYIKRTNSKIRNQRDEIEARRDEIEAQRDEVEAQHDLLKEKSDLLATHRREILDSITYAEKIQSALMPPEQYFHEILNEVFILFKPRDIVSGDFYWTKQVNGSIILAAADCTGHGVPGAFMSMLGMSYLNEIVHTREITTANQILDELRKQIINSLRQQGRAEESKDGIDMALCVIDEKNKILQYSGANNPLYLISTKNGSPELTEFKADRMPLGYYQGKFKTFTNIDIQFESGDVFYLFSDGFVDQQGGMESKKFLSKNFKRLLLEIYQEPLMEQKKILDKTITDWMGENQQIDDIMVIGVRV